MTLNQVVEEYLNSNGIKKEYFDYVMRGWKLEELNDQREKNMSSLFDYIVLGNQEGKIKDGSE